MGVFFPPLLAAGEDLLKACQGALTRLLQHFILPDLLPFHLMEPVYRGTSPVTCEQGVWGLILLVTSPWEILGMPWEGEQR